MFRSSTEWLEYYQRNRHSLRYVPWELSPELSIEQREAVTASIQGFQLGESSEGKHLYRVALEYAGRTGDQDYPKALALFIKEEQRHAADLGRFMDSEGIPRIRTTWPDSIFRWLRHGTGLETSVVVLVTAEIIAKVYYAALREATASDVLQALCDQILQDEFAHVEFQCERLGILRQGRGSVAIWIHELTHRILFCGTLPVVWWKHGRAMRAGGFGFLRFWSSCWAEFETALVSMDPSRSLPGRERLSTASMQAND